MTALQAKIKYHFIWRQSIVLCRPIALLIFFLFCLGTANAQTTMSPLATYTMNYSYATGCRPPDWPNYGPSDGNPYCVTQSVGQIQEYNAAPGSYCVEVVNGYMPEWSSARVWSGTTTSGIRYDVPSSGSITINHTTGKLVFYSWDWYRGDNPPYYVTVNLYSGSCIGGGTGSDSDGDGVPDRDDKCPGTPKGTKVNKDGCPDADGDGVADSIDTCPNTPSNTSVDAKGCPTASIEIQNIVAKPFINQWPIEIGTPYRIGVDVIERDTSLSPVSVFVKATENILSPTEKIGDKDYGLVAMSHKDQTPGVTQNHLLPETVYQHRWNWMENLVHGDGCIDHMKWVLLSGVSTGAGIIFNNVLLEYLASRIDLLHAGSNIVEAYLKNDYLVTEGKYQYEIQAHGLHDTAKTSFDISVNVPQYKVDQLTSYYVSGIVEAFFTLIGGKVFAVSPPIAAALVTDRCYRAIS